VSVSRLMSTSSTPRLKFWGTETVTSSFGGSFSTIPLARGEAESSSVELYETGDPECIDWM